MKKVFFLILVMVLLSGCAKKIDLGPGYERTSKHFMQALRWQDYQGAAMFLAAEDRQPFLDIFEPLKDLHIVEATYKYGRLNEKEGRAESELILQYYMLPSTRIKSWAWKIDWVLIPLDTEQRGRWQIQGLPTDFPEIKK